MIGIGSGNDAPLQQRGKVIAIEMDAAANADGLAKRQRPHRTALRQQFQDPLGDRRIAALQLDRIAIRRLEPLSAFERDGSLRTDEASRPFVSRSSFSRSRSASTSPIASRIDFSWQARIVSQSPLPYMKA